MKPTAGSVARADGNFAGLRALLVEDSEIDRYLVQRMLMDAGFTVDLAANAEDALSLVRDCPPDLVCSDVCLPAANGYVLVADVRARYPEAHIPFIFITGLSDEDSLLRCFAAGADDVVIKPINAARLKAKISAALRTRELHRTLLAQRDELARYQADTQRDMAIAKSIIDNLGSERTLDLPNVTYHLAPLDTLNGDIIIGGRSPSGAQCFLFGDFTGHGLPAAIGVQVVHGIFCAMVARGHALELIAAELNRKVRELLPRDRFLSAVLIEIFPDSGTVSVWNGGMPEVMLRTADGQLRKGFRSTRLPLGVLDATEFDATPVRRQLREGDTLFCYSDGVIEALDAGGTMFARERVMLCLGAGRQDMVAEVRAALAAHIGEVPQQDDISMLAVRFEPAAMLSLPDDGAPIVPRHPATHWRCALEFGHDALRCADPVPALGAVMDAIQGFGQRRAEIYMVVTALFSHALEQGLLQLDGALKTDQHGYAFYYRERERRLALLADGGIRIELEHTPDASGGLLEVRIEGRMPFGQAQPPHALVDTDRALLERLCESWRVASERCSSAARYRWRRADLPRQGC